MKRQFTMLTLLISDPKQLGNDIDVYSQPLINDLQILWEGVQCYDAYKEENSMLRKVLLWTVNDFSTYGNLFGQYYVKGYKTCLIYSENTRHITEIM